MHWHIAVIFQMIAFIASLVTYKKTKGTFMQWISIYLFYIVFVESIDIYFGYTTKTAPTYFHLTYQIASNFFYCYIFYNVFRMGKRHLKKILLTFLLLIVLLILYNHFFISDSVEDSYRIRIVSGIFLSGVACYYLYTEFINDNLEELLIHKSGFWIASGVLLFYSGYSIVITLHPFTSKNKVYIFDTPVHTFFTQILSVFLYSCITIALIVWKPKTTTSY